MSNQATGSSWTNGDSLKPMVGISSCLLGEPVRYDGGHKRDRFLTDTFGPHVTWVPVCPEIECGLPTPRPAMRLVGDPKAPRLVVRQTGEDKTDQMQRWISDKIAALKELNLCGFIFKRKSPSSGMERVRVYGENGQPRGTASGLFAAAFMAHFPLLPVEDEGRLKDPDLRENFIERIFCLSRYRTAVRPRRTLGQLVKFHTVHKLQLLAHSPANYRQMGALVANGASQPIGSVLDQYQTLLLKSMKLKATVPKHVNVMQHMLGYFKRDLTADEKQEILEVLDQFKAGYLPLIVPITLMRHHVRKYGKDYLDAQTYLNPHPIELKLRNHS